ncbi:hypothetical protein BWI17_14160 [Betaproteobacteria bacterium GR16-43]|nr:hypothetical protein BWI17_14160 [Betaproteobacteria bacterium GR16-43]
MTSDRPAREHLYRLSNRILDGALEVHAQLGPGLAKDAYEAALCRTMTLDGLRYEMPREVPVGLGGLDLDGGIRLGLLVEECVVVEVEALAHFHRRHVSRLRQCLAVTRHACGLLINFEVAHLPDGIHQVFCGMPSRPFSPSRSFSPSLPSA